MALNLRNSARERAAKDELNVRPEAHEAVLKEQEVEGGLYGHATAPCCFLGSPWRQPPNPKGILRPPGSHVS
ncbi:hypothetical protein XHV734_3355 [Xanthomonas hortorum pv. vitians]|nr:hypothetical protein XHV734_3355 [Xanthomonas hortorum pv. vitians]